MNACLQRWERGVLELLPRPPSSARKGQRSSVHWTGRPPCSSPCPHGPRRQQCRNLGTLRKLVAGRTGTPHPPDLIGRLCGPVHWPPGGTREPAQRPWSLSTLLFHRRVGSATRTQGQDSQNLCNGHGSGSPITWIVLPPNPGRAFGSQAKGPPAPCQMRVSLRLAPPGQLPRPPPA